MRIGVLTGGGDCPGLNAVIRAIVRKGVGEYGHEFVGYRDGWRGPLERDSRPLGVPEVRGILPRGGTILGSSRTNPFKEDGGAETIAGNLKADGVDGLIAIGGEDTLGAASQLHERGVNVVGVPKTIDNDLERHRLHLRLRHGGQHRDVGDRPAPHDGREPQADADLRGDGPPRRLDRLPRRALGRRQRDPDPRDRVRPRPRLRLHRPPLREPVLADRRGRRGRAAEGRHAGSRGGADRRLRPRPSRRDRPLARGRDRAADRPRGAGHGARPRPARRHADRLRPGARHPLRPARDRRGARRGSGAR